MNNPREFSRGFTLMELLIYIGIFAGISVAVVSVLYITSTVKPGIDAKVEVQQNMRLALEVINRKTAEAVSVEEARDGFLKLIMPTVSDPQKRRVTIFATTTENALYMEAREVKTGESDVVLSYDLLTSEKVQIDSLVFGQIFQPPAPRSVSVQMAMSYKAGGNPLLEFSSTLQQLFPIAKAVTFDSGLFPNTDNNLNIGASTLRWKNAYFSGEVGIGTAEPAANLHIAGADGVPAGAMVDTFGTGIAPGIIGRGARGTKVSPSAVQANDNLMLFGGRGYGSTGYSGTRAAIVMQAAENWTDSAQGTYITFETTPTASTTRAERMRITADGNVGIGTTNPGAKIDITGRLRIAGSDPTPTTGAGLEASYASDISYLTSYDRGASTYKELNYNALQHVFRISGSEKVRIDSAGNVGIGTTEPVGTLHIGADGGQVMVGKTTTGRGAVVGAKIHQPGSGGATIEYAGYWAYDAYFDDSDDTWKAMRTTLGNKWKMEAGYHLNDLRFSYSTSGDPISWSDLVAIKSTGNVGIGTTNPNSGAKLHVAGNLKVDGSRIIRKINVQVDTTTRNHTTSWALGPTFSTVTDFKADSLVELTYHVPMRNDSAGWGGGYIEPQISFNGGSTWNSLGSSGYDGGVMNYGTNAYDIGSYFNSILIDPGQSSDFSVTVRFYYKSYDGTVIVNGSHDINAISGTATLMSGNNGLQHYTKVIIKELY